MLSERLILPNSLGKRMFLLVHYIIPKKMAKKNKPDVYGKTPVVFEDGTIDVSEIMAFDFKMEDLVEIDVEEIDVDFDDIEIEEIEIEFEEIEVEEIDIVFEK